MTCWGWLVFEPTLVPQAIWFEGLSGRLIQLALHDSHPRTSRPQSWPDPLLVVLGLSPASLKTLSRMSAGALGSCLGCCSVRFMALTWYPTPFCLQLREHEGYDAAQRQRSLRLYAFIAYSRSSPCGPRILVQFACPLTYLPSDSAPPSLYHSQASDCLAPGIHRLARGSGPHTPRQVEGQLPKRHLTCLLVTRSSSSAPTRLRPSGTGRI